MLPTKILVNWLFSTGEEAKNRFSRWPTWRPAWISDRNNFSYFFLSTSHPDASYSFKSIGLSVQEKRIDFQDGCYGGHLGFPMGTILAIFDLQITVMLPT